MGVGYTLGAAIIMASIWISGHEYIGFVFTLLYIGAGFHEESNVRKY